MHRTTTAVAAATLLACNGSAIGPDPDAGATIDGGLSALGEALTPAPDLIQRPVVQSLGQTITLQYDEPLDDAYVPAAAAFTLHGTTVQARSVSVAGAVGVAQLNLDGVVIAGATLTLDYARPTTLNAREGAIRDPAGNRAASFSGLAVGNRSDQ